MRTRRLSELSGNPAETFLEFGYPELKWLCLFFVFLGSLFLICSLFSLRHSSQRSGLIWCGSVGTWGLFTLAIASGGHGLWRLFQIAEDLVLDMRSADFVAKEYNRYVESTYGSLDSAGYAFVLGLIAYVATHAIHIFVRTSLRADQPIIHNPAEDGAHQPATDQESKAEGNENLKPKSDEGSR